MCGIFGWSLRTGKDSLSNTKRKKLFEILSACNDTRGGHSWGIYVHDDSMVHKGIGKLQDAVFSSSQSRVPFRADQMFAHTRWATHGKVTLKNAHPFTSGNIVGAHNGIIWNHDDLNNHYDRDFDVDSQHIFQHISEDIPLDDLEGYGAIEWANVTHHQTTYLGRFDGDLAVAILKGGLGVVWTSSKQHLEIALGFARITPASVFEPTSRKVYAAERGQWRHTDLTLDVQTDTYGFMRNWESYKSVTKADEDKDHISTTVDDDSPFTYPCDWCQDAEAIRETSDDDCLCQECYDYWADRAQMDSLASDRDYSG